MRLNPEEFLHYIEGISVREHWKRWVDRSWVPLAVLGAVVAVRWSAWSWQYTSFLIVFTARFALLDFLRKDIVRRRRTYCDAFAQAFPEHEARLRAREDNT